MKKPIVLIILSLLFVATGITILTSFTPVANENSFIVVRILETPDAVVSSRITISDGTTILKTIPLSPMFPKNEGQNLLKIVAELNELKTNGYTLISSNSGGSSNEFVINYVFEKK